MKTLNQIVNAVRDGERPDYEELRYAVCALESLGTFNRMAFMRLAEAEREGKKPMLTHSAQWQWEEHFRREKTAGGKSPKEYVGWNNDPDNPEFLKRRGAAKRIMDAAVARAASQQPTPQPKAALPLADWHEDIGPVLWWVFPVTEPPYCGTPIDAEWPCYHTHWTRIPVPTRAADQQDADHS